MASRKISIEEEVYLSEFSDKEIFEEFIDRIYEYSDIEIKKLTKILKEKKNARFEELDLDLIDSMKLNFLIENMDKISLVKLESLV